MRMHILQLILRFLSLHSRLTSTTSAVTKVVRRRLCGVWSSLSRFSWKTQLICKHSLCRVRSKWRLFTFKVKVGTFKACWFQQQDKAFTLKVNSLCSVSVVFADELVSFMQTAGDHDHQLLTEEIKRGFWCSTL